MFKMLLKVHHKFMRYLVFIPIDRSFFDSAEGDRFFMHLDKLPFEPLKLGQCQSAWRKLDLGPRQFYCATVPILYIHQFCNDREGCLLKS